MTRGNLAIETGAMVARVLFEGSRAIGVEYRQGGEMRTAHAGREVLLSGGVINSPQLLMLSGIGDPDELAAHGIAVKVPLKGVGRNLQDHLSVSVDYRRREQGPFPSRFRADRIGLALAQAYFFGTGFATDLPGGCMGFIKSDAAEELPDIQVLFRAAPLNVHPYVPLFQSPVPDGFGARAVLLRPKSRGAVNLTSADPATPVRITQNFLVEESDRVLIRKGVRLVQEIGEQAPIKRFIAAELAPGPAKLSDADLDAYVRKVAATAHHPLGTCKMGADRDEYAVVDAELRVRGVDCLRVVDAAVMPDLVGGNINACVIMIAERAADLISGRPTLAPVNL
jgi:choline dehydrogenase/4-pyridoxate dehydrogenase